MTLRSVDPVLRCSRRALLASALGPAVAWALRPSVPSREGRRLKSSGIALGTLVELYAPVAAGWTDKTVQEALDAAMAEFRRLDGLMNHLAPESDVGRVNAAAGSASVEVSEETFALVRRCGDYAEFSGGVFDITYAALTPLWRFDGPAEEFRVPEAREVARMRKLIDYRKVVLEDSRHAILLPSASMRLGLGGIARGYAVDRARRILEGRGVQTAILRAAGATFGMGTWPSGPFFQEVADPRSRDRVFARVELKDHALSVVRDDERAVIVDGKRFHPVIDPRTGFPARTCRLAAVLCPNATDAEWLSKSLFILGLKDAQGALQSVSGAEALVVTADNRVEMTEGMARWTRVQGAPLAGEP